MKDRYLWWRRADVELEHRHAVEEGRDVSAMEAEFEALMSPGVSKDGHFQHRVSALMLSLIHI